MVSKEEQFRRAFIGTSLDGYIEASRVTQLDNFVRSEGKSEQPTPTFQYVKPAYRLQVELEKRGFKKGEVNGIVVYTRWRQKREFGSPPIEYPQRAWVTEQRPTAGSPLLWGGYWEPSPNQPTGLPLVKTEDEAINELLKEIDSPQDSEKKLQKCDYCGKEVEEVISGWDMEEKREKNACKECDLILSI